MRSFGVSEILSPEPPLGHSDLDTCSDIVFDVYTHAKNKKKSGFQNGYTSLQYNVFSMCMAGTDLFARIDSKNRF